MTRQKVKFIAAILVLLLFSALGAQGLINQFQSVTSFGQQISTAAQVAYVILGVLAAFAFLTRRRWSRQVLYAWAVALVLTGGTAPVVWGGAGLVAGILAVLVTALIAACVFWLLSINPLRRW